jgi:hypothetical protein
MHYFSMVYITISYSSSRNELIWQLIIFFSFEQICGCPYNSGSVNSRDYAQALLDLGKKLLVERPEVTTSKSLVRRWLLLLISWCLIVLDCPSSLRDSRLMKLIALASCDNNFFYYFVALLQLRVESSSHFTLRVYLSWASTISNSCVLFFFFLAFSSFYFTSIRFSSVLDSCRYCAVGLRCSFIPSLWYSSWLLRVLMCFRFE